jgi:hypothetical protein
MRRTGAFVTRDEFKKTLATAAGRERLGIELTADEAALVLADDAALDTRYERIQAPLPQVVHTPAELVEVITSSEQSHSPDVPPVQSNVPAAGWFPDSRPFTERWWDGTTWSDVTRQVTLANAQPVNRSGPAAPRNALPVNTSLPAAARNLQATPSVVAGAMSALGGLASINAGGLSVAHLAVIVTIVTAGSLGWNGLKRAKAYAESGGPAVGRLRSIWGLSLAGAGAVLVVASILIGVVPHAPAFNAHAMEQDIQKELIKKTSDSGTTVSCPTNPSTSSGSSFKCVATFSDSSTVLVKVTYQDNVGSYIWQTVSQ